MPIRKRLSLLLSVFLLSSCALLPTIVSDAQYEFDEGLALFHRGQYEKAIPRFQKATEIDPDFGRAYLYLGRSNVSIGRWRQALPALRAAYRLSPEDTKREAFDLLIDALFGVALEELKMGHFTSSIDHLREVQGLQPASAKARNQIVKTLIAQGGDSLSRGNASEAIRAYTEAAQLSPESFEAIFGLAKAFFKKGEFFKAREALQDAMRVNPGNPEAKALSNDLQRR
jgi:tetratricopeptide (TPR) repeat protein